MLSSDWSGCGGPICIWLGHLDGYDVKLKNHEALINVKLSIVRLYPLLFCLLLLFLIWCFCFGTSWGAWPNSVKVQMTEDLLVQPASSEWKTSKTLPDLCICKGECVGNMNFLLIKWSREVGSGRIEHLWEVEGDEQSWALWWGWCVVWEVGRSLHLE